MLSDTQLVKVDGFPGDFQIRLARNGDLLDRTVGAIVLATDYTVNSLHDDFGLALGDPILTPSQLEEKLSRGEIAGKTVAFFCGLGRDGNPLTMERLFRNVSRTLRAKDNTAYIFTGDLKIAAPGLDRMYRETRDQGAIYMKMKDKPAIGEDGKTIVFHDPIVDTDFELTPDLIVVEEEIRANPINETLSDLLRIDAGPTGFLQLENVHRFTVNTNREGIFVAGPGRDIQNAALLDADSANVALSLKTFHSDGATTVARRKAVVDTDKCVICLTCYRCCPHGAISWGDKAVISAMACQGCGICAGECPQDAIQIQDFTDTDVKTKIQEAIKSLNGQPGIIAFCCRNSAYEAGKKAMDSGEKLPEGLRLIEVPCAGKIDVDYILNAFVEGAGGIMVLSCHEGNCKSEHGNTFAGRRVKDAHRMLEEIGLEAERLSFATIASNQGRLFAELVCEMEAKLKTLS